MAVARDGQRGRASRKRSGRGYINWWVSGLEVHPLLVSCPFVSLVVREAGDVLAVELGLRSCARSPDAALSRTDGAERPARLRLRDPASGRSIHALHALAALAYLPDQPPLPDQPACNSLECMPLPSSRLPSFPQDTSPPER
ncbi:uncharacterized protein B0H18DRAFT_1122173 [Fomitopsis serialis]|uniref:uncharacterized protein n=1 Tax=Fomitopsis serialis TaxID=139415 RepID=UPI0020081661|nr:uncharacterized protein B0H18DRAFT_1122173 [Neoantrodia serialis]KAH9920078.1 hypothetical protein B0H18DRAFT_1122173 [Neoantrodia serialis]